MLVWRAMKSNGVFGIYYQILRYSLDFTIMLVINPSILKILQENPAGSGAIFALFFATTLFG